nr:protein r161 [Murid betaherpesvirus 2]
MRSLSSKKSDVGNESTDLTSRVYCCYVIIILLVVVIIVLSAVISVRPSQYQPNTTIHDNCPQDWIGFSDKCYYFSDTVANCTESQKLCKLNDSDLARFDNEAELDLLLRYKKLFDYWIGLYRDTNNSTLKWRDNTLYTGSYTVRGVEKCGYLSDGIISTARMYADKRRICSKSKTYTLQSPLCPVS